MATLLLLAACIAPLPPPSSAPQEASSPSIASSSVSSAIAVEGDAPESSSSSSAGADLHQRFLTGGLLEIGEPGAPLSLLLFTNHFCNYCKEFHETFLPRLLTEYVAPGKLRIITLPFPLKKYPESDTAAITLLCAAAQGKGWEMHDLLFQGSLTTSALQKRLTDLGLSTKKLQECLKGSATAQKLITQKNMADALGVAFVPTFFLNGEKMVGLPTYAEVRGAIEAALNE